MKQVYEHYKGLMADSFDGSPGFCTVLDEACKSFVNAVPRVPEWLARYAHCLLDKVTNIASQVGFIRIRALRASVRTNSAPLPQ